tara:strand:- start:105 stop:578 length:474 start_codon:yes stop_codon:yes gene_type:complete
MKIYGVEGYTMYFPNIRLILILIISILSWPTWAQYDALTCAPYVHGEAKLKVPTFFCAKREDAEAYIDVMERRRLKKITRKEGGKLIAEFQRTRECFHIATSHTSRRTLHQGVGAAPHCQTLGLKSTKWPSLIEAELTGDKSKIWILTNALVPPIKN